MRQCTRGGGEGPYGNALIIHAHFFMQRATNETAEIWGLIRITFDCRRGGAGLLAVDAVQLNSVLRRAGR